MNGYQGTSIPVQPTAALWEEMYRTMKELQGQVKEFQEKQDASTSKASQYADSPKIPHSSKIISPSPSTSTSKKV